MGVLSKQSMRSQLHDWLRLRGYVAFDLPRVTTALGISMLLGNALTHCYVLISRPELPAVFVTYAGLVGAGCVSAAAAMAFRRVSQLAWFLGDVISVTFLGLYLSTRPAVTSGFSSITGRWDFAPGTLAAALALAFIAVHATVLLGINVALPRHQHWSD